MEKNFIIVIIKKLKIFKFISSIFFNRVFYLHKQLINMEYPTITKFVTSSYPELDIFYKRYNEFYVDKKKIEDLIQEIELMLFYYKSSIRKCMDEIKTDRDKALLLIEQQFNKLLSNHKNNMKKQFLASTVLTCNYPELLKNKGTIVKATNELINKKKKIIEDTELCIIEKNNELRKHKEHLISNLRNLKKELKKKEEEEKDIINIQKKYEPIIQQIKEKILSHYLIQDNSSCCICHQSACLMVTIKTPCTKEKISCQATPVCISCAINYVDDCQDNYKCISCFKCHNNNNYDLDYDDLIFVRSYNVLDSFLEKEQESFMKIFGFQLQLIKCPYDSLYLGTGDKIKPCLKEFKTFRSLHQHMIRDHPEKFKNYK